MWNFMNVRIQLKLKFNETYELSCGYRIDDELDVEFYECENLVEIKIQ